MFAVRRGCIGILHHSPTRAGHSAWSFGASRTYASASTANTRAKKPPVVAKGSRKSAQARPGQSNDAAVAPRKSAIHVAAQKALAEQARREALKKAKAAPAPSRSSTAPAKSGEAAPEATTSTPPKPQAFNIRAALRGARVQLVEDVTKQKAKDTPLKEAEQRAAEDEKMNMDMDTWSHVDLPALDVLVPPRIPFESLWNNTSSVIEALDTYFTNYLKNATSMYMLAVLDALPGISTADARPFAQYTSWVWRSTRATSIEPDAWIAGVRAECFKSYKLLATAVFQGDTQAVYLHSSGAYRRNLLTKMREWRATGTAPEWMADRLAKPVRILSIRAVAVEHNERTDETKYVVQALVRFDTLQIDRGSFLRRNDSMDTPPPSPEPAAPPPSDQPHITESQDAQEVGEGSEQPQSRNMVEYLIMERKLWTEDPWVVREELDPPEDEQREG